MKRILELCDSSVMLLMLGKNLSESEEELDLNTVSSLDRLLT